MRSAPLNSAIFLLSISSRDPEEGNTNSNYPIFMVSRIPNLSLVYYSIRLNNYLCCSSCCFILAIALIEKLLKLHPELRLNSFNIHKFFKIGFF